MPLRLTLQGLSHNFKDHTLNNEFKMLSRSVWCENNWWYWFCIYWHHFRNCHQLCCNMKLNLKVRKSLHGSSGYWIQWPICQESLQSMRTHTIIFYGPSIFKGQWHEVPSLFQMLMIHIWSLKISYNIYNCLFFLLVNFVTCHIMYKQLLWRHTSVQRIQCAKKVTY